MRLRSILALSFLTLTFAKVNAQDDGQPVMVNAPITAVYAPMGFDDNDNSQVIVEGEFPNTCYKVGPARVKAIRDEQKVVFQVMAIKYQGICLEVRTPFIKVVDVGILPEGRYQVASAGSAVQPTVLNIHHTESRMADDYLYAPIDAAFVHKSDTGDRRILTLTGAFPNSCMQFSADQNSVIARRTSKNIIEVLPVVEMKSGPCLSVMVPFAKSIMLNEEIPTGKYLVHIRTLNGQSYNKIDFVGADPTPSTR